MQKEEIYKKFEELDKVANVNFFSDTLYFDRQNSVRTHEIFCNQWQQLQNQRQQLYNHCH